MRPTWSPKRRHPPDGPRSLAGPPGRRPPVPLLALLFGLTACATTSGTGVPTISIGGAATEREPGLEPEDRREAELRETLLAVFRAEERYHADHDRYTDELFALRGDQGGPLPVGPAGRLTIPEDTETGFSAVARQAPAECAIRVGTAKRPRSYVRSAGIVFCR